MGYANLASDYVYRDLLPQAENTLERSAARKLWIPDYLSHRYRIAFLKGDEPEMERLTRLGEENPELEDWMHYKELQFWHIPVNCNGQGGYPGTRFSWRV